MKLLKEKSIYMFPSLHFPPFSSKQSRTPWYHSPFNTWWWQCLCKAHINMLSFKLPIISSTLLRASSTQILKVDCQRSKFHHSWCPDLNFTNKECIVSSNNEFQLFVLTQHTVLLCQSQSTVISFSLYVLCKSITYAISWSI